MHLFLMYQAAMHNQNLRFELGVPPRKREGSGKRGAVTPADFKAWREARGWSMRKAAEMLGVSFNTLQGYEEGGANVQTGLAMSALAAGLEPFQPGAEVELSAAKAVVEATRAALRK